jgi:erythronate-4-phosphate dehydrogenase
VWPHEPDIDADLLGCCDIATPHIAGYSLDGKLRAVDMVFKGVCQAYGIRDPWSVMKMVKPLHDAVLKINGSGKDSESVIGDAVLKVYDPGRDDCRLRRILAMDARLWKGYFDHLRRTYPVRREFGQYRIVPAASPDSFKRTLVRLGFRSALSR